MFPLGADTTEYQLITKDYVKVENWNGHEMLVVDPEALTVIANVASHNCSFMLRREHNEMVAMRRWQPKGYCRSVRIPVHPYAPLIKVSRYGPAVTTRKRSRMVSTKHILKITCVTLRTHL